MYAGFRAVSIGLRLDTAAARIEDTVRPAPLSRVRIPSPDSMTTIAANPRALRRRSRVRRSPLAVAAGWPPAG